MSAGLGHSFCVRLFCAWPAFHDLDFSPMGSTGLFSAGLGFSMLTWTPVHWAGILWPRILWDELGFCRLGWSVLFWPKQSCAGLGWLLSARLFWTGLDSFWFFSRMLVCSGLAGLCCYVLDLAALGLSVLI